MPGHALVLYGTRISPFVEKVWRAVAFKGLECRLVEPTSPTDFARWNPQTKKIPVFAIDGERLYDSTFILRRLDALVPEPALFAAEARTAAEQKLLEDWADESLYWYVMALRWTPRNAPATARQIFASLSPLVRVVAKVVAARQIAAMTRAQGFGRLPEDVVLAELAGQLDNLVLVLGSRPFFHADRLSAADLAIYGQFHMMRSGPTPEAAALIDRRPALREHMRRVETATGGEGGQPR